VLVSVDTLRADRLGCYGNRSSGGGSPSPSIDRLAGEGVLCDRAQAPRGQTWPSLTSLLTGEYPLSHGVRKNGVMPPANLRMLPHHLRDQGYATGAFVANYGEALTGLAEERGLDALVAPRIRDQHELDHTVAEAALEWIEKNADRRCFTWLHLMNPHRPYEPPADLGAESPPYDGWLAGGMSVEEVRAAAERGVISLDLDLLDRFVDGPRGRGLARRDALSLDSLLDIATISRAELSPDDLAHVLGQYDGEIRASDRLVGRLLETLDALGLTDDTLVVFTSDHGEELYDHHQYFFHQASIYEGVLRVPLVFRWPGHLASGRWGDLVELTDVLPTVLDLVGARIPGEIEGRSRLRDLMSTDRPDGPPPSARAVAEVYLHDPGAALPLDAVYAVRGPRFKLIVNRAGAHPRARPYGSVPGTGFPIAREELYDLRRDPREQVDLLATPVAPTEPDAMARARYLATAYRARIGLLAVLERWWGECAPRRADLDEQVPDELAEELAALGYVDTAALPSGESGDAADAAPTRRLVAELRAQARSAAADPEQRDEAERLLAEVAGWQ
jgi:arylsulfatase A-like enzyme